MAFPATAGYFGDCSGCGECLISLGCFRCVGAHDLGAPTLDPCGAGTVLSVRAQRSCIRSQPIDRDEGYETIDQSGRGPNYPEVIQCLLQYQDRISQKDMVYLIVDNRDPADVPHWPAFEKWWASRRQLVGPHQEKTDVLWVTANQQNGLRDVPYYWAGVFVLEIARFLYPRQHFGLVDNDCVPVTLFETPDLVALATRQLQWTDLVGLAPDDQKRTEKVGLLLVTEAHLEYNAGLVISLGSQGRPSPITQHSTAETLADDLADYRSQLLAMARPPENPTGTFLGGNNVYPNRTAISYARLDKAQREADLLHCDRKAHQTDLQILLQTNFIGKVRKLDAFWTDYEGRTCSALTHGEGAVVRRPALGRQLRSFHPRGKPLR